MRKYELMKDLYDVDIKARLPQMMASYLKENSEFVLTPHFPEKSGRGYPTGQYIVRNPLQHKINNVIKELPSGIDGSLHMNHLMICFKSKYIHTIEQKLQ